MSDVRTVLDRYQQRYLRGQTASGRPASSAPIDPIEADIREQRERRLRVDLLLSSSPDTVGRATRLAREVEAPPLEVEDRMAAVERGRDVDRFARLTSQYPAIGRFASQNPRGAAAAADDWDSLSLLGKAWRTMREFVGGLGPSLASGAFGALEQVEGAIGAAADVADAIDPSEAVLGALGEVSRIYFGYDPRWDKQRRKTKDALRAARASRRSALEQEAAEWRPQSTSWIARELLVGTESIPLAAAALLTRNPAKAGAVMGGVVGGGAYQDAREAGADIGTALAYGARQGTVEAITERMPAARLLGDIAARSPFGKMLLGQLATEIPGEQAATLLQDFDEWVTLNPSKTLGEFIEERPAAARQTLLATIGAVGTTTSLVRGADRAATAAARVSALVGQAQRARREGAALAAVGDAAAKSRLRERDPEAFAALMREMARETGATAVYIPADAMREFMQSDAYVADDWAAYEEQTVEALATGGDLVMPVEEALSRLPGTPAWDMLRGHMRLSAGGMSAAEAEAFNLEAGSIKRQMDEVIAAEERTSQSGATVDNTPRTALIAGATAKLQAAGYTPAAARTQAELIAARYSTRAARLGQPLTGQEFDGVEVRQILPEKLVLAMRGDPSEQREGDGLDPIIDAMRSGITAPSGGRSLLDFIAQRGGIMDVGGDIASMGGDRWHRGRPGRRKLIKPHDKGQASMLGGGQRTETPELVLRAAIDAGYFPELEGLDIETAGDALDTNILLEAIGEELAGSPRYAREVDTSRFDAVRELETLLVQEGLNPADASRRDIRAAIAAYSDRQAGMPDVREYEQAAPKYNEVQAAWDGAEKYGFINMGPVPPALTAYGLTGSHLSFGRGKIRAAAMKHGVDAESIARLPELLNDPWIIMPSSKRDSAAVVVALRARDQDGNPLLAVVEPIDGRLVVLTMFAKTESEGRSGDQRIRALLAAARRRGEKIVEGAPPAPYPDPISGIRLEKRTRPILRLGEKGKVRSFDQSGAEANPRGRITFPGPEFTGSAVIELFQSRNMSTFVHELGHLWLEELRLDASSVEPDHPLARDWQLVQDWFAENGHPLVDGVIPVEAHEMWARGVEAHLLEGRAPTAALAGVFEQVRSWLVSIYRSLKALNTPINPDIRGVMDRLLATDDDLALAREEQGLRPLFDDASAMTGAEFDAYQRAANAAREEGRRAMLDKTVRDVRARETRRYRRAARQLREEVEAEVRARPAHRAIEMMRRMPIDRGWIEENMGSSAAAEMPRSVPPLVMPGGVHPDTVAEQTGYPSGRDMIEALIELENAHRAARKNGDARGLRERIVDEAVKVELRARYGEPLTDGAIEREALAAAHNDMAGEMIAAEVRVLARQSGQEPTPYAAAKAWARDRIRRGTINQEASPAALQRYARAAKMAARRAEAAYLERDSDTAFRAKQAQMLNNALLSEAKAAMEEADKAQRRLAKIAARRTIKAVDQDYLEQAHALLEAVSFKKRTQKSIVRQGKWESWAAARQAEGFDIVVPGSFEAVIGQKNWTQLSVEEFMGLNAAVMQVIHLGKLKQELSDAQKKRDFEKTVGEAVAAVALLPQRPASDLMEPGMIESIKSKVANVAVALLKMETVFDWLDSGNSNGIFNRIVFRPIADAQEAERIRFANMLEQLNAALAKVPQKTLKSWGDKVSAPELINRETGNPFVMTRDQAVAMALNIGNASNLDKLIGGYRWSEEGVRAVLNRVLTKEEWAYVQEVWDIIESLWPDIAALERRVNGLVPDKIEPLAVDTPFGTLRGGYYPVVYDPRRNYESEAHAAAADSLFEGIYIRATTPKGFTKERTAVERPIHLSLGVINRHVGEVIHDLTHREAVMQADKFLQDRDVMKAVDKALGPEVRQAFRPWLQRIANEWAYDRAAMAGAEAFMKAARLNTTIVAMGFRVSTVLMQAGGIASSIERVGARWIIPRLKDVVNADAWNFVLDRSKEVRGRMDSLDRDIRDNVRKAAGQTFSVSAVKRFAFYGIGYMDRAVVIPTWLGAYDKALSEGMNDADAVYAADKAVRQSQGAGAAKDLAAIQTGRGAFGETGKLLTMFYSFMSAWHQRTRVFARDVRYAELKDAPGLIARAWWLFVVPPLLAETLAGRLPDDDEDETWTEWAATSMIFHLFGPIPILRDFAPVAYAKMTDRPTFGYRFTPVQGAVESSINVAADLGNIVEGEETTRATRNAIETVGYFTGLTTGQMATAAQFLVDIGHGEQDPEGFAEWYQGLTKGKVEE